MYFAGSVLLLVSFYVQVRIAYMHAYMFSVHVDNLCFIAGASIFKSLDDLSNFRDRITAGANISPIHFDFILFCETESTNNVHLNFSIDTTVFSFSLKCE